MKTNNILVLLIDSLTEYEKTAIQKKLVHHPKKLYAEIFQKLANDSTRKKQTVEKYFEGKVSRKQLSKYKKEIYSIIIEELEAINNLYQEKFAKQELLKEFYNLKHRYGMLPYSNQLLEKVKKSNWESGSKGFNYDVIWEQMRMNFHYGYSPQKHQELITELWSIVNNLTHELKIEEIKFAYQEIRSRNMHPVKGSADYKAILKLLSDPVFSNTQPPLEINSIYNWYNMQARLLYSIKKYTESQQITRIGIEKLLSLPSKGNAVWKGIHNFYINFIVTDFFSGNHKNRIIAINEMRNVFEANKNSIHPNIYKIAMFELFGHEVLDCLIQPNWEKGIHLVKKNWKKSKLDYLPKYVTGTLLFNIGLLNFGLGNNDKAIDSLNEALQEFLQNKVFDFVVLVRVILILCHIEKKQFPIALSGIDALRKYMSYQKNESKYKNSVLEFLKVLRRWINNRGSGQHHKILEQYYLKHKDQPTNSILLDYFWVCSKVEQRTMQEVAIDYHKADRQKNQA